MDMIVKMMDKQQATMVSTKQSAMARAMAQRYGGKSHEAQAAIRRA